MTKDEMKILMTCFDEIGYQIILWQNDSLMDRLWIAIYGMSRLNYPEPESEVVYFSKNEKITTTRVNLDTEIAKAINDLRARMDDRSSSFDGYMLV